MEDQDEDFILGYGLSEDPYTNGRHILLSARLCSRLQGIGNTIASNMRDLGYDYLFDGEGETYSDLLEIEDISLGRKHGSHIYIKQDLIGLSFMVTADSR